MGLAALLVCVIFTQIPIGSVTKTLLTADIPACLLGYIAIVGVNLVAALQLMLAMSVHALPFGVLHIIRLQFISVLYTVVIPSELTSSVVKWWRLSATKEHRAQAASTVIYCRVANCAALFALGLPSALLDANLNFTSLRISVLLVCVFTGAMFLPLISTRGARAIEAIAKALCPNRLLPGNLRSKGAKLWRSMTAFGAIDAPRRALLFFLSLAQQFLGAGAYWLLFEAVGISLTFGTILWLRVLLFIINAVPLTVSGLGIREATLAALLPAVYGVFPEDAVAASLLLVGRQIVLAVIGGGCELYERFIPHREIR